MAFLIQKSGQDIKKTGKEGVIDVTKIIMEMLFVKTDIVIKILEKKQYYLLIGITSAYKISRRIRNYGE